MTRIASGTQQQVSRVANAVSVRLSDSSQPSMFSDFSIEIDGRANIFGAGKDIPPAPDGGGELLPLHVSFAPNAYDEFTLTAITGTISGWAQTCDFGGADFRHNTIISALSKDNQTPLEWQGNLVSN